MQSFYYTINILLEIFVFAFATIFFVLFFSSFCLSLVCEFQLYFYVVFSFLVFFSFRFFFHLTFQIYNGARTSVDEANKRDKQIFKFTAVCRLVRIEFRVVNDSFLIEFVELLYFHFMCSAWYGVCLLIVSSV